MGDSVVVSYSLALETSRATKFALMLEHGTLKQSLLEQNKTLLSL